MKEHSFKLHELTAKLPRFESGGLYRCCSFCVAIIFSRTLYSMWREKHCNSLFTASGFKIFHVIMKCEQCACQGDWLHRDWSGDGRDYRQMIIINYCSRWWTVWTVIWLVFTILHARYGNCFMYSINRFVSRYKIKSSCVFVPPCSICKPLYYLLLLMPMMRSVSSIYN